MSLEGSQLGHYRLTRQIGSGGMGEIYLAEDTRIARQVAVKVVRNEPTQYPDANATQESTRLFRREMKAVASLDNPHILTLLDFGEETINRAAITYMVMPYRSEGSLNDWMSQHPEKLSLEEINNIVQQAADALQHAHDSGIIHQDVKPSNFLIRSKKDKPNQPDLLLADFGIAKMLSATSTASQTSRGTATFMPPEQWDGNPVPATDQYALAIMAYLLLTGQAPFQGRMEQVMRQQFMTEPQPPSKLNPAINADVDKVILHALAKKPEERFASVSNFANAFQQALQYTKQPTSPQPILEPTVYASGPLTPTPDVVEPTAPASEPVTPASGTLEPTAPASEPVTPASGTLEPTVLASSDTLPPPPVIEKSSDIPPPPPIPKRSKSRTRTIVLVVLALLVILGSIIGITTYQNHVYQVNAAATADADYATYQADQANATATSQAVDQANATATSQAIDQANAAATAAVVSANPYPSYLDGQGKLIFYDSLAQSSCQKISSSTAGYFIPCYLQSNTFFDFSDNFAFEVQLTITRGDCGGMLFRVHESSHKYYYYRICQNGTYQFSKYIDNKGSDATPIAGTTSSVINVGSQTNTIAVIVNGDTITLYFNGNNLYSTQDSSYSKGSMALFADSTNNPTVVSFSNARVWTL